MKTIHVKAHEVFCHDFSLSLVPNADVNSEEFVMAAADVAQCLPSNIFTAIAAFKREPHVSGALLLHGLPVGVLPDTPPTPTTPTEKDNTSEMILLAVAKALGEPVGYKPEMGGHLIQNIVPTQTNQDHQISTSSKVLLMFHTEAAFHPHRPAYLLLFCLRGDDKAYTLLASIREIFPHLSERVKKILFEPRFRTAVDESYLHGRTNVLGELMPVLSGNQESPTMIFDADLMIGVDDEAQAALHALSETIEAHHASICLQTGDLLIVDNAFAVHGRTSYTPQFDGKDRWLQRSFVVNSLSSDDIDREGRVIVTSFGVEQM